MPEATRAGMVHCGREASAPVAAIWDEPDDEVPGLVPADAAPEAREAA